MLSFNPERILFLNDHVVIFTPFLPPTLFDLHSGHASIYKMKFLVCGNYWWPGINNITPSTMQLVSRKICLNFEMGY